MSLKATPRLYYLSYYSRIIVIASEFFFFYTTTGHPTETNKLLKPKAILEYNIHVYLLSLKCRLYSSLELGATKSFESLFEGSYRISSSNEVVKIIRFMLH